LLLGAAITLFAPDSAAAQWLGLAVPERPAPDAVDLEAGRAVYEAQCWFCHGEEGDGEGPVAPYLWPRPRDFTMGSYKLRTTASGELPLDEDLFRTITLGIPGTAMPQWGSTLSEAERWQVVGYIKGFAADLFEDEAFDPYQAVVEIGEPPQAPDSALIAAGRQVYDSAKCWECHAADGRGGGERAQELTDDWEYPLWPANLHLGWRFKGGSTAEDIYARLSTGLDGSPIPSYALTLTDDELWQVAYYSASLQDPGAEERPDEVVIEAVRVRGALPTDPGDPAWEAVEEWIVPLTGQATHRPRWQIPAVTDVSVRALYDAEEVAIRLQWDDRFADTLPGDAERAREEGWTSDDSWPVLYPDGSRVRGSFPDAAEVVFPVRDGGPVLPHFVYGSASRPVELWRWQADLQHAPNAPSAVVGLRAAGADEPPTQDAGGAARVSGGGGWEDGRWTVVLRRPLDALDATRGTRIQAGGYVPIALHVWDGGNGETGLKMALSSWYFLHLREATPAGTYAWVLAFVGFAALLQLGLVRWARAKAQAGELTEFGVPGTAAPEVSLRPESRS
jgi:mono/diheme cytochrome c family protein